ncbi:hypothetical protein MNEG_16242, partial [Monoraphidium neglectum]
MLSRPPAAEPPPPPQEGEEGSTGSNLPPFSSRRRAAAAAAKEAAAAAAAAAERAAREAVEGGAPRGAEQADAAGALAALAERLRAALPSVGTPPAADGRGVTLGESYVDSPTLSDVTFTVEGRPFRAHRTALLASSDAFRAMFEGGYREAGAGAIEIPNISWAAFDAMMRYVYTGQAVVPSGLEAELLAASDQYLLDGLKTACQDAI